MISQENENLQNVLKKSEDYIKFATVKASILESLKRFGSIPDEFSQKEFLSPINFLESLDFCLKEMVPHSF